MSAADREPNEQLVQLVESFCNDTLSRDDRLEFERLLLKDAEARSYFRRHAALDSALREYGLSAAAYWLVERPQPLDPVRANAQRTSNGSKSRWTSRLRLWGPVVVALSILVYLSITLIDGPDNGAVIASLEQVTGDVRLLAANGQTRTIQGEAMIRAGDTVRTSGDQSASVITYPDGTRLTLVGNTSATCGTLHSKSFVIHHGTLAASVAPQRSSAPMVLATPTVQVEVLGTKFLITVAPQRTDLNVTEGRVRLVRIRDDETVEVVGGKRAIVTEQKTLLVEDIPLLLDSWEVDFEEGLPAAWDVGEFVTQSLPANSRGAVRAARHDEEDGLVHYSIKSETNWAPGLFAIGKKSHLHVTMKMDNPLWVNLLVVTRTADPENPQFSSNFIFTEYPPIEPGKWLTISIPLSEFSKLHDGPETIDQLIPYKVVFDSTAPDRGLVIDRLWITPDGPGEIRVLEVK